jgi:Predicted oxidoreductases (related to aryl-alcohol dehydrogenases)
MQKRQLGNSGLEVAPLAFGGNVFGFTVDEQTSYQLLDSFTGRGFNLIDTADGYSRWKPGNKGGESETIIGNWMKKKKNREKVIIATKVGTDMGEGKKGLSKKYILQAVDASLKRLQTDYIDLYQSHFDDLDTPVSETIDAYTELVQQGKVRAIGASNMSAERLLASLRYSEANHLPKYETLQPEYNLYSRERFEKEFQTICLKNNLSVINYFPLASGFLTGKYRSEKDLSKSIRGDGIKKYLNPRGHRILIALDETSKRLNSTPAAVSLAWLMIQPTIAAPIASATSIDQLDNLVKAVDLQLDEKALADLNEASSY